MNRTCVFCGFAGKLSAEHVFGDWLNSLGLGEDLVPGGAGLLNRNLRDIGVARPFSRTVRTVCAPCNNGWMSALEAVAARALSPIILGRTSELDANHAAALTAWVQKTALVSMCMLSNAERRQKGGLPAVEYRALYEGRRGLQPLPDTQLWIARYSGWRSPAAVHVTPMAVRIAGIPEPDVPQAYVATIVVGSLLLQCIRFTTPGLAFELVSEIEMAPAWPATGAIQLPLGPSIDDKAFERVAKGLNLGARDIPVALRPWTPATDLPRSTVVGSFVQMPTPCCQHTVDYPKVLVEEALLGIYHAFLIGCACGEYYLVCTEADGAHIKLGASQLTDELLLEYERLEGEELVFAGGDASFVCKRLAKSPRIVTTL